MGAPAEQHISTGNFQLLHLPSKLLLILFD